MDYPMVVIDSWDAITSNLNEETKRLEEKITSFARKTATHNVLVTEHTEQRSLDYLVDGIVTLKDVEIHGEAHFGGVWGGYLEARDSREIYIEKLRGTHIKQKRYTYSLYQGRFQYFEPFLPKPLELLQKRTEDPNEYTISSGNRDFDDILGKGFSRGSFNLLEMEHGIDQRYIHLLASTIFNVASGDKGLILFPVGGRVIGNLKRMILKADHSEDILIVEGY